MKINRKTIANYWYYFKVDNILFMLILSVFLFGVIMLYSASSYSSELVIKQLIHISISIAVMLAIAQISPQTIQRIAPFLMSLGIILLIMVILFGVSRGGATRWLDLGIIMFQPSEIIKIILPTTISAILSQKNMPPKLGITLISIGIIAITTILIAIQPDLGTAIIIAGSGIFVLFFAGVNIKVVKNSYINFIIIISTMFSTIFIIWNYLLKEYQQQRILTMLSPELDSLGSGYHIIQSKIAIGSGGLLGRGYGNGTQSQLDFLPEHATDFIFSTISEELGFIGISFLLFLYALIFYRCIVISLQANDTFSKLLSASLTMVFFSYVFINIFMVTGLIPVVGVPLPFISYGGSSILTLMMGFGMIMSIHKHKQPSYLR